MKHGLLLAAGMACIMIFGGQQASLASSPFPPGTIMEGRVSVIDGDTIEFTRHPGVRVRLFGIDAPESSQTCTHKDETIYRCGREAALALADIVGRSPVTCQIEDFDWRYQRPVATCYKNGKDLNAYMVETGHAVAYHRYSTRYTPLEDAAKSAQKGIWKTRFVDPAEWRRTR